MITSAVYRLLAKCRSRQLDAWTRALANADLLSAVPRSGAQDGHCDVAIRIEHTVTFSIKPAGGVTDFEKCFDRAQKEIIIPIALIACFPTNIMHAHRSYIANITIYHGYAVGLSKPRGRPLSIPHGCHFSMMFLVLIMSPWTKLMRVQGAIPRALASDLTTISGGEDACNSKIAALLSSYAFFNEMGGKCQNGRNLCFFYRRGHQTGHWVDHLRVAGGDLA